MSKIKIKQVLKSSEGIHEYNGLGLFKGNKITYIDNNIKTSIVLGDIISLIRKSDYQINLNFKLNETLDSYYKNHYGNINLKVKTEYLKKTDNFLEIHYSLMHQDNKISDFEFILEYSIDT